MKDEYESDSRMTRRTAIRRMVAIAGSAAASTVFASRAALADSKQYGSTPKSAVHYQNHPKGNDQCSNCMHFIPGPSASAAGHCTVVKGSIAPKGWCLAYTPAKH